MTSISQQDKIDITRVRCLSNHVLVKVRVSNDKIRFENGVVLFLDTNFSPFRHASVNCEVMAVPDHLVYGDELDHNVSMPHKTEMELQVGDEVIIKYLAYSTAFNPNHPKHFKQDDTEYFFVPYSDIFVAKRKWTLTDENLFKAVNPTYELKELEKENIVYDNGHFYTVIPLNGLMLCSALTNEYKTSLIIPEYLKKQPNKDICTIDFCGSANQSYWKSDICDDNRLKNGMKIIVDRDVLGIMLEPQEHLSFLGNRMFHKVERHLVHGFFE
jgi:hypothetical protein